MVYIVAGSQFPETRRPVDPNVVMGPALPRLPRVRTRSFISLDPQSRRGQARNPLTGEITADIITKSPTRFAYQYCEDSIRNKDSVKLGQARPIDDGGDFSFQSSHWSSSSAFWDSGWVGSNRVSGSFWSNSLSAMHEGLPVFNESNRYGWQDDLTWMIPLGPKGWAEARPAQPAVGLGILIGEIRQLPGLLIRKFSTLKDVANWHLAVQFGWRPLLSDLIDSLNFMTRVNKQIAFLKANSGKPVRRQVLLGRHVDGGLLFESNSTSMFNTGTYRPSGSQSSSFSTQIRYERTREAWFSGEFVFALRSVAPAELDQHLMSVLLGLRVTPDVVWNLMPWSWFADWWANYGDVLQNTSNDVAANQFSTRAYVMGKTIRSYSIMTTDGYLSAGLTRNFVTKSRRKVDPYGVYSQGTELDSRRASLLLALGLQRVL